MLFARCMVIPTLFCLLWEQTEQCGNWMLFSISGILSEGMCIHSCFLKMDLVESDTFDRPLDGPGISSLAPETMVTRSFGCSS